MEHDLHSKVQAVKAVGASSYAADTNGDAIDTAGFESLEWIVNVGSPFVDGGFDITLEESPDDGSGSPTGVWSPVPDEHVLGGQNGNSPAIQIAIGDGGTAFRVGSVGKERHQRVVLTETGAITSGELSVTALLGNPRNHPVDDQNT